MPPTVQSLGLDRLSRAERLALVQDLWDSIVADGPTPLSESRRRELERRGSEIDTSPDDSIPWEQVKAEGRAAMRP